MYQALRTQSDRASITAMVRRDSSLPLTRRCEPAKLSDGA